MNKERKLCLTTLIIGIVFILVPVLLVIINPPVEVEEPFYTMIGLGVPGVFVIGVILTIVAICVFNSMNEERNGRKHRTSYSDYESNDDEPASASDSSEDIPFEGSEHFLPGYKRSYCDERERTLLILEKIKSGGIRFEGFVIKSEIDYRRTGLSLSLASDFNGFAYYSVNIDTSISGIYAFADSEYLYITEGTPSRIETSSATHIQSIMKIRYYGGYLKTIK